MTQEPQQSTTNQNPPSGEGWWEDFRKLKNKYVRTEQYGVITAEFSSTESVNWDEIKSFISHVASKEYERGKREERGRVLKDIKKNLPKCELADPEYLGFKSCHAHIVESIEQKLKE